VEGLFGPLGDPDYDSDPPVGHDFASSTHSGIEKNGVAASLDSPSNSHVHTSPAATEIGAGRKHANRTRMSVAPNNKSSRHSQSESLIDGVLSRHKDVLEAQLLELLSLHLNDSDEETRVALTKDVQLLLDNNHRQVTAALGTELRLQEIRWRQADFWC